MSKINTDPQKIEEILTRGVHEVFTYDELKKKLESGKKLHIKLGTDVTGPNLHLGHTVAHRKLRDFQELGHDVTLVIGDFTTLVGDHSDKVDMRSDVSAKQIQEDEKSYKEQFFKTVHEDQTTIRHNSEWLSKLNFGDVIGLTQQFTVAQMLDRETFQLRYKQNRPIGLDEFLYPLMQGYDSIALECDVELGGTDQTFNLLAGRKLMENKGMVPQNAVVMKLLTGSDGKPMGKSLQNFIPVLSDPVNMYGLLMSIVDEVIFEYFELLTRVPMEDIEKMEKNVKNGENPMKYKKLLAKEMVTFYHGEELALEAEMNFEKTVQKGSIDADAAAKIKVNKTTTPLEISLEILKGLNKDVSTSEVKRIIKQGGFEINGKKVTDPQQQISPSIGQKVKLGKRTFGIILEVV